MPAHAAPNGESALTAPEAYDAWYETPRGSWIGQREGRLILRHLKPAPADALLDVGCGTGFFTRYFARRQRAAVVGIDPDRAAIRFARGRAVASERYVVGSAEALPFRTGAFDLAISVTALCFIADQDRALREVLRVTRRRFAIGLLNRHSLLWRRKGRGPDVGGYRGARWHTRREAARLFASVGVAAALRTAVHLPSGGGLARLVERVVPSSWPWGSFLLATGRAGRQTA
jgi:SAM-dependent methyltransferase